MTARDRAQYATGEAQRWIWKVTVANAQHSTFRMIVAADRLQPSILFRTLKLSSDVHNKGSDRTLSLRSTDEGSSERTPSTIYCPRISSECTRGKVEALHRYRSTCVTHNKSVPNGEISCVVEIMMAANHSATHLLPEIHHTILHRSSFAQQFEQHRSSHC